VRALTRYEEVERQVKPNHRLADFVIWGEVISRVIGNKNDGFLKAWLENIQQQNVTVAQNDTITGLLVDYVFKYHQGETEIKIGPLTIIFRSERICREKKLDVGYGHWFSHNPEWLVRIIQAIKLDLKAANILVENGRTGNER